MGADWLKFKVRSTADMAEVRDRVAFINENYPHGYWTVPRSSPSDANTSGDRWQRLFAELRQLLVFPKERNYFDYVALTDPPGSSLRGFLEGEPRANPSPPELECCRIYVISHNSVFPIEWRDEAYRIILPDELCGYVEKWTRYAEEVRSGRWRSYLHDLYLFDRLKDQHQFEQLEDLDRFARESLTRSNAWCQKTRLTPVREEILRSNLYEQLKALRSLLTTPRYDESLIDVAITSEQLDRERQFEEVRQAAAIQIREWNRRVPTNWKLQFPTKQTFENFLKQADSRWLASFLTWCHDLIDDDCGLFLWC